MTCYLPSTLALLGLALLLGATVYETIVMAPNYERDIPRRSIWPASSCSE